MAITDSSKPSSKNSSHDESNAKYSVVYHSGLEVVDRDNAPEVVPLSNINRTSLAKPPYHAAPYYSGKPEHQGYYEAPQTLLPPEHEGLQSYSTPGSKEAMVTYQQPEVENKQEQRRCCGIRRGIFIAIVVAVAAIVCIAVILGAVLGTVLPEKSATISADGSLQTWGGTGLASTLAGDGSGRLLTYYQDPDGRIIENSYLDGTWTLEDSSNIDLSVVTTQAAYSSQLAAISYKYGGKTYRQIFFTTSTGAVMTANSTETSNGIATNWSVARPITSDRIDFKGIGLTACWSDLAMNGIRAFYPSQYGYIQEVKWTFGGDSWKDGAIITSSDPQAGVGCAVKNTAYAQYLNLYYRNINTRRVKQAYVDYTTNDGWSYYAGARSWANMTIATGSDIAVCNDASQTEYVYYQLQGGLVTRGIINPTDISYEGFEKMKGATVGTKLACSFVDGGSMLFFQNRTSTSTIYASDVSRSGVSISNFAIP